MGKWGQLWEDERQKEQAHADADMYIEYAKKQKRGNVMETFKRIEEILSAKFELEEVQEEKILASNYGIDLGEDLICDFKEPEYPRGVGEQIQKDEWMLDKGFITEEEILMREKGDISLEEAKRILKQNKKNLEQVEKPKEEEEEVDIQKGKK